MGSQIVGHDLHAWTHIKYRYRKPDKTNISLRELLQARNPCNYHPSLVFFFFKNGLLSSNPSQLTSLSLHPREVLGFPCGSPGKQSTHNAGDLGLVLGLGRSPGEGKGYPVQYSSLENSMDYSPWGLKELDTTDNFHFPSEENVPSTFPLIATLHFLTT